MLIQHLSPDSAFVQAVLGGPQLTTTDVLADIFDVLALANWQRGADPKHPPKKPPPYPRRGDELRKLERAERVRSQAAQFLAITRAEGRHP